MRHALIIILLAAVLGSCTITHLHDAGTYTVQSVEGQTVKFKGVRQLYKTTLDSLKPGSRIRMLPTTDSLKAHFVPL